MLAAYYKSCVLDYYKKMAIDQLYSWVEAQQELVTHQEKIKQERYLSEEGN
jgi:hypothetical protein